MAIIHDKIEAEPQALTIHAGMAAGSMWPYLQARMSQPSRQHAFAPELR